MRDTFTNANFPRTAEGRLIALGIRPGEVANRIITVGAPSRAEAIASLLDQGEQSHHHDGVDERVPAVFRLISERGFLTITGRFHGVPVSVVSIGMGSPNMDFFVREVRECVSGDLIIVRLGSCGGLLDYPVGTLVVPTAAVSVRRNYDYDFLSDNPSENNGPTYLVSRPVIADSKLRDALSNKLRSVTPLEPPVIIVDNTVNASTDSFYSSQGRRTSFPDHNETLIDDLLDSVPRLATFEMETFHLLHLASVWRPKKADRPIGRESAAPTILPSNRAPSSSSEQFGHSASRMSPPIIQAPCIRAAAVQMIFAQRRSQDFITPSRVAALEEWSGRAVLEALIEFDIPEDNSHPQSGSVWDT